MKSTDYEKAGRVTFGVVDVIAKWKTCGKENCGQCPHGPVWYVYIPAFDSMDRKRTEIYLGRVWVGNDLREKVAPKVSATPRREFLAQVESVERAERIAWLKRNIFNQQAAIAGVVYRHQKEVEKLREDQAKMQKELKQLEAKG